MATLNVRKLNLRRLSGVRSIDRRVERTDIPAGLLTRPTSFAGQIAAAVPGDRWPSRAYVAAIDGQKCGYAIVSTRTDRYRWDVRQLGAGTQDLDPTDDVSIELWSALLEYATRDASRHGVRRIFASAPESTAVFYSLVQSGFEAYTRQSLVRGELDRAELTPDGFRRMHASDVWSVHQLYHRSTPPVVQFAEAVTSKDWELPSTSLLSRLPFQKPVTHQFVVDSIHGICAYCQIQRGSCQSLVTFLVESETEQSLVALITAAVRASGVIRGQPFGVVVPGYQREYVSQLLAAGMDHGDEYVNLVKHTTAPVVVRPALRSLPVGKKVAQPASSLSMIEPPWTESTSF